MNHVSYPHCRVRFQSANGHEDCVSGLLETDADVTARDVRGRTPLHMAAMCGHVGLLGMLLQVGRILLVPVYSGFFNWRVLNVLGDQDCFFREIVMFHYLLGGTYRAPAG